MKTKYENAVDTMKQFKVELGEMKKMAKEGDTMPAEVFFVFMDVLVPAFDGIIEEIDRLKGEEDVSK